MKRSASLDRIAWLGGIAALCASGCDGDPASHASLAVLNGMDGACLTVRLFVDSEAAAAPRNALATPSRGCEERLSLEAPQGTGFMTVHARIGGRDVLVHAAEVDPRGAVEIIIDPPVLTVTIVGEGTVSSQPLDESQGLFCVGEGSCSMPFIAGARVNLDELAEPHWVFSRWSEPGPLLSLDASVHLVAVFALATNTCGRDDDCPDGATCLNGHCEDVQCASDGDCGSESRCVGRYCVADPGPEPECLDDGDCADGLRCEQGQCVPFTAECSDHRPCPGGLACVEGFCRGEVPSCDFTPDCPDGLSCFFFGWCLRSCTNETQCEDDQICSLACLDICSHDGQCPIGFTCLSTQGHCAPGG